MLYKKRKVLRKGARTKAGARPGLGNGFLVGKKTAKHFPKLIRKAERTGKSVRETTKTK